MTELFVLWPGPPPGPGLEGALCARLSPEQRAHVRRQKCPAGRTRSLLGSVLVRMLACQRLGIANSALAFFTGPHGKPGLEGIRNFAFNVSHTDDAVAVAVSTRPVGVDIERVRPARMRVARRYFTAAEADYIGSDPLWQDRRFFEVWTKKEACLKMTGAGLSQPLSSFSVLEGDWPARLAIYGVNEYLLACCCADRPAGYRILDLQSALSDALQMDPVL